MNSLSSYENNPIAFPLVGVAIILFGLVFHNLPKQQTLPCEYVSLGKSYFYGTGIEKNDVQAAKLFLESAEAGCMVARHWLGGFYIAGTGVPANIFKAYIWSVCSGMSHDENPIYSLLKHLTSREIAEGRRLEKDGCRKLTDNGIEAIHRSLR